MKNKYYHSNVNIIEYPFKSIKLDTISNELKDIVKKFNSTKDKLEKTKIANLLPDEIFNRCRFCNEKIINSNFKLNLNIDDKTLGIGTPSIGIREIDGKIYHLSCCEHCLLEHFKDKPPKHYKYYFMKANKYGQYSFGYSDDEYKKICSMTVGVTKNSMIRKWGEEEGIKKWNKYCDIQAKTNLFEYKKEKYNWTEEEFKKFNQSRAITLKNMQAKYGEEQGKKIFEDYVNKQKLTKSQEYMINKFGLEKTNEINKSKALTLENYIKKHGEEEGTKRYEAMINHQPNFYSKISQKFFDELDKYLGTKYTTYYATKNGEYGVKIDNKTYIRLDYFILELNLCIEFNGTYYHGDPRVFEENDHPNPHDKETTAKEMWDYDKNRYEQLKKVRGINTIIIWENDYNKNFDFKDFIINKLNITL